MTVALVFHCPNCLVDFEDACCDLCGRNLAPKARHLTLIPDSTVSRWLVRLNDIARDDWSRHAG